MIYSSPHGGNQDFRGDNGGMAKKGWQPPGEINVSYDSRVATWLTTGYYGLLTCLRGENIVPRLIF